MGIIKKLLLFIIFININNIKPTTIDIHSPDSAILLTSQSKVYVEPGHNINVFAQETFLKNQETENIKNCFENNTVYYKTIPATKILTQQIDLANKTLYFFGNTHLTKQSTIESSGKFNLDGNTIYLDSDFSIPENTTLTITSSGIIDGQDNTLTLEKRAQILLDSNICVTFKNLTFKNKLNTERIPPIKCQNSTSQAIFDNIDFAFTDDFYFTEGQFFINNEVNYTGTSQFVYTSTNKSYIQPNSKFKFNPQTSFYYDQNSTNTNLIVLQNETSCFHFDGSILKTSLPGLELTKGLLRLNNNATFSSYKEDELTLTYSQNYGVRVYSVNWSPDGNYLAIGGGTDDTKHDEIEVYSFDSINNSLSLTYSQNHGGVAYSVNWSPDGNYLAVGSATNDTEHNEIEIYSFDSINNSLSLTYSQNYGSSVKSVDWSPDGNYLAIGGYIPDSGNETQIYYFDGSALSLTYSQNYGSSVTSVNWSPDGNYLAVGGGIPDTGHDEIEIYSFNGSSLSLSYSQNYGGAVLSVDWSPDGNFLAVGGNSPATEHAEIEIYYFNDSSLSLTYSQNYGSVVYSVNWGPNGNYLAVGGFIPTSGDEIQIYSFNTTNSTLSLTNYKNYGNIIYSVDWTPDGNYLAVGGYEPDTGHDEIEVYSFKPVPDGPYNITLGNSTLGPEYDLDIKVLGGARVSLDYCNLIYDNTGTTSKTFDFVNRSSSIVLDTDSTFSINRNNIKGWHQQSILRQEGHDNSFVISNTTYGYGVGEIEPDGHLLVNDSNAIVSIYNQVDINSENIRYNSNAIVLLDEQLKNTYEYLEDQTKNNSNSIIFMSNDFQEQIENNSNAIIKNREDIDFYEQKITNNSNAIVYLDDDTSLLTTQTTNNANSIINNSNLIIYTIDSNDALIIQNSNAIVSANDVSDIYNELDPKITNNSNAIIHDYEITDDLQILIDNNSDRIKYNSNAIINNKNTLIGIQSQADTNSTNIRHNSNSIVSLAAKSTTINNLVQENQDAITLLNQDKTILETLIEDNSNSIINMDQKITNSYDYLSSLIKNNSDAFLSIYNKKLAINNSNAILNAEQKITNNSNAIIDNNEKSNELYNATQTNKEQIEQNSNAIITLDLNISDLASHNKNSLIYTHTQIKYNSNAIIHDFEITDLLTTQTTQNANDIKENSNAIITSLNYGAWDTNITDNENNIRYNSNTIINVLTTQGLQEQIDENKEKIKYNSNYILLLDNKITNSFEYIDTLITQNSNAIIHDYEITDDLQNQINNINQEIEENSNTIIYNISLISTNIENINNNSNAIIYAQQYLSKQIKQNSEAIINTQLLEQIEENSNAIVSLQINLNQEIKENSNVIINNDNDINTNNQNVTNNSNAIIQNTDTFLINYLNYKESIKNNSNAIINDYSLSYSLITRIRNNSKGILYIDSKPKYPALQTEITDNAQDIKENSNAIIHNNKQISELYDTIRHNSDAIINFDSIIGKKSTILTKEPITGNIELDQSAFIHPEQRIEIADNAIIDGKGAVVLFGATDYSQFKIQAGKTVTLKNIQLLRINQKTFDLRYKLIGTQLDDGQIKIGQNVLFGISENITFSQGLIEILNNDQDEAQLFHIKGIEGQKQFKINPSDEYSNALSFADNNLTWDQRKFGMTSGIASRLPDRFTQSGTVPVLVKCNNNTFGIQNINLSGFEHITKSTSGNYTGAIGLLGESDVDVGDDTFTDFEQNNNIQEKYDMVFVTQNLNNSLRILKDDLKFTGQLQFADYGENVLHIDSMLTERIKPKTGAPDPTRNIPQINFATNFLQLTSAFGTGRLIFDDNRIRINNDENGFVAYENSFLGGHTIEVTGDPIWDLYDPSSGGKEFVLEVNELIGLDDINNQPIISEFYSSLKLWNTRYKRIKTAIDLIYEKELAKLKN